MTTTTKNEPRLLTWMSGVRGYEGVCWIHLAWDTGYWQADADIQCRLASYELCSLNFVVCI